MELPPEMLKALWRLKRYCGAPPIIEQVRESVTEYLRKKEKTEIGTSIEDAVEAIEKHEHEQKSS